MEFTDWIMIAAIFFGPIVAVRLTRYLDDRKDRLQRRFYIFRTLMATRAVTQAPAHVESLNLIDIEFSGSSKAEREIREAWKVYLDHLNNTEMAMEQWAPRRIDLLTDLLQKMGRSLGYDFDRVHIGKSVYFPRGHGEFEDDQGAIRRSLRTILEGERPLPMWVVNLPIQNENNPVEHSNHNQQTDA